MSSLERKQPKASKMDLTEYVLNEEIAYHPRFPANTAIAEPPAPPDPWITGRDLVSIRSRFVDDYDVDDDSGETSQYSDYFYNPYGDKDLRYPLCQDCGGKAHPLSSSSNHYDGTSRLTVAADRVGDSKAVSRGRGDPV